MADPGATYDGASEFAGTCLQLLQKGCFAKVRIAETKKATEEPELLDAATGVEKSELTTVSVCVLILR